MNTKLTTRQINKLYKSVKLFYAVNNKKEFDTLSTKDKLEALRIAVANRIEEDDMFDHPMIW